MEVEKARDYIIGEARIAGMQQAAAANAKSVREEPGDPDIVSGDRMRGEMAKQPLRTAMKPVPVQTNKAYAVSSSDYDLSANNAEQALNALRLLNLQRKIEFEKGSDMHSAEARIRELYSRKDRDGIDLSDIGVKLKPTY